MANKGMSAIKIWFFFVMSIFILRDSYAKQSHLQILKSKYPYGILGDDYGILNLDDLTINACTIKPMPFTGEKFTEYPYWQCFETKKSKLICDGYSYWKDFGTIVTLLVITAKNEDTYHEYLSRKVVSFSSCQEYKKDWKRLTKNEKYVCVSGMYNEDIKNSSGDTVSYWIFDKFKTRKGCISYFYGDCSLKYQIKNGCHLTNPY